MKKLFTLIILIGLLVTHGWSQEIEIHLEAEKDCNTESFCVDISLNASAGISSFEIGTSSILLSYNPEALSFNNYSSVHFDGSDFCLPNGQSIWDVHAYDAVSRPGKFSLVISLNDSALSCPSISNQDTIILGTLCFNILQQGSNPDIKIDTAYSDFNNSIPNNGSSPISINYSDSVYGGGLLLCDCSGAGTPCDDQNVFTVNDQFDVNCNCEGEYADSDNDGILDGIDPCFDKLYEAEDAELYSVYVYDGYAQFTGSGYVDYNSTSNDYVEFKVVAEEAGIYTLHFRYALEYGSRPMALYVNNSMVMSQLGFPATGAWDSWDTTSYTYIFQQDTNYIRLQTNGYNGPNLDHLTFSYCGNCQLAGTACNDNNDCTQNDVYDLNCDCHGMYVDSDQDGVCDAYDICNGGDDNIDTDSDGIPDYCDSCNGLLIGSVCDDGDPCTVNDSINSNCDCVGDYNGTDSDNDGVCDAFDICPGGNDLADIDGDNIPDLCDTCNNLLIGLPCSDGDTCTVMDTYTADCQCIGIYVDSDGDGVCNIEDLCEGFNDSIDSDFDGIPDACDECDNTLAGGYCDDGDPCTYNDMYDADCNCIGTFLDSDQDGICNAEDLCFGYDDNIDNDLDYIPDSCDVCFDIIYEAEDADRTSGTWRGSSSKASGGKYVSYSYAIDTLFFEIEASVLGTHTITFRYSLVYDGKLMKVDIDGVTEYNELSFPKVSSSYNDFGKVSFSVFLFPGTHTIMLINDHTNIYGPRLDYVSVCSPSYRPDPVIAEGNNSFEEGLDHWETMVNWNNFDAHLDTSRNNVYCGYQAVEYHGHGGYEQLYTTIRYLNIGDTMTLHFYTAGAECDVYVGPGDNVYSGTYHYVNAYAGNGSYIHDSINFVVTEPTMLLWFDLYPGTEMFLDNFSFHNNTCEPELLLDAWDISCIGEIDGEISADVYGGAHPYAYSWSTGDSTNEISGLNAGFYSVTVSDAKGFTDSAHYEVMEPLQIEVFASITNASDSVSQDGMITSNIYGGTPPFSYEWSNGHNSSHLVNVNGGIYSLSVTDSRGCSADTSFEIGTNSSLILPEWYVYNSGSSHIVLFQPTADITINNSPIENGDLIGAFYDSSGTLACAGYMMWHNTIASITIFADDASTTVPDGFAVGEEIKWKIWKSSEGIAYNAEATYLTGIPALPNAGSFTVNGLSGIESLHSTSANTHTLILDQGWDIISSYIDPANPGIENVFAPVIENVTIIKDDLGMVFWPLYGLNQIQYLTVGKGYLILMQNSDTLTIQGSLIQPELYTLSLPANWSMLGYLRTSPAPIESIFTTVVNNIVIIKDGDGNVYWPQYGINFIQQMLPGKGYLIKLSNNISLTYPPNMQAYSKSYETIENPVYFHSDVNTGSNMTLGIPLESWNVVPKPGDEVGVFDSDGILIGASVFTAKHLHVTIWGKNNVDGSDNGISLNGLFYLKLWKKETGELFNLDMIAWKEGDNQYDNNKIAVLREVHIPGEKIKAKLYENSPNPFSLETSFSFYIPESSDVTFEILTNEGKVLETLISSKLNKGFHSIEYHNKLSNGIYYYRLTSSAFTDTKQMVVIH